MIINQKHYLHLQKKAFLTLCLHPAAKTVSVTFLQNMMLCCTFHIFRREQEQGGHEAVSEGGTNPLLWMLALTWGRCQ